jgi:dTMP kinase
MAANKGILVALEGIDGAGKTTQVKSLERILREAGVPFLTTKEPTEGPWGAKIRASARHGRMSPQEELEAFINDRRQHVAEVIEPALARGMVVLVDRYYLSTVAYQGARGFDPGRLLEDNAFAPAPDVLIVLDIEPSLGLQRIRQRGDIADLFEKEEELGEARQIFRTLGVANLHVLDATRQPESLTEQIAGLVFDALRSA